MRARTFEYSNILGLGFALVLMGCSRTPTTPAPPVSAPPPPPATVSRAQPPPVPPLAAPSPAPLAPCDPGAVFIFTSPARAVQGKPLRVIAVFDEPADGELAVLTDASALHQPPPPTSDASGADMATALASTHERQGGPPYFLATQIDSPPSGNLVARWAGEERCGGKPVSKSVHVFRSGPAAPKVADKGLWKTRGAWTPPLENLYSAWVQHLFDAPVDAQPSWSALHDVLRDSSRNLLFDHLGVGEDDGTITVRPDCADLPYFLRAYFAFKLGLPFGWSTCSRGDKSNPPTCRDFLTNEEETRETPRIRNKAPGKGEAGADPAFRAFAEFLRSQLADATQSGAGRTRADDDDSDYYPVPLSAKSLRPGTVFADPYGHVLVIAKRIPQTAGAGGVLLAVDGQPDGTVARKRFWRGNFLFAVDPATGSPGWKRFRPLVRDRSTGKLRRTPNRDLEDYSVEQYEAGAEGFYDKMHDVLSPEPQPPDRELLETLQALEEQAKTRVISVDNGRRFLESGRPPADMPDGAKLFETNGAWEDFSTPSRDMRLLIALDVVRDFPATVARRPEHYALPQQKDMGALKAQLDATLAAEMRSRHFAYTRSDGSEWTLSLFDLTQRAADLEVAYDPNDCVERRWGAPAGSPEAATCVKRAPPEQTAKMDEIRGWFHDRKRPPRE